MIPPIAFAIGNRKGCQRIAGQLAYDGAHSEIEFGCNLGGAGCQSDNRVEIARV